MKNKLNLKDVKDNDFDNFNSYIKITLIHSELIQNETTKINIPYNLQLLLDNFPENNIKSIIDISYEFQTGKNEFIYPINNENNCQKHSLIINAYYISLFFIRENFGSVTIPIEFNNYLSGKKWYYLTDQNKNICIKLLIQIDIKIENIDLKLNRLIKHNLNLSNNTKTTKTNTELDIQSHVGKNSNFVSLNSNSLNNINFTKLESNQNIMKFITNNEIIEQSKNISRDCDYSSTIYNNDTDFYETSYNDSLRKETIEKKNNIKSDFFKLKKNFNNNFSKSELLEEIETYEKNTFNYINDIMYNIYNKDEIELNKKMNNFQENIPIIPKESICITSLDTIVEYKKNKKNLILQLDKFLINNCQISTNKLFNYKINKKFSSSKINQTCGNIKSKNTTNNLSATINNKTKEKKNHNSININKLTRKNKITVINTNKKIYSNNTNEIVINKEKCNSNILSKNILSYSQRNMKKLSKSSLKLIRDESNNKICQKMINYHIKDKKEEIFFFNKIWKKNDLNINQFNKRSVVTNQSTDSYKKINFTNSSIHLTSVNEKKNKKVFKNNLGINKEKKNYSQKQIKIDKNGKIGYNEITELDDKRKKTIEKIINKKEIALPLCSLKNK